jgi:hypothetical protein
MSATRPPLAYLATCSQMSLESVELSRLNRASNLRKEFQQIVEEWIDSEVDARLARSILEWRRGQDSDANTFANAAKPAQFEQLAIAFLPASPELSACPPKKYDPELQRASGRPNRVAPAEHAQSPARIRKPDRRQASPRQDAAADERPAKNNHTSEKLSLSKEPLAARSVQLARAAEMNLREVGDLAKGRPRRLRESRQRVSTNKADALSCAEPPSGSRCALARVARPISEHADGAIEFVPLRAVRDEPEALALVGYGDRSLFPSPRPSLPHRANSLSRLLRPR